MSRIGYWYATGPADKPYSLGDPEFNRHTVIEDESDAHPSCVKVRNQGGDEFLLPVKLADDIAGPPEEDITVSNEVSE